MTILYTAVGAVLVAAVALDIFREVVKPNSSGAVSLRIARVGWVICHALSPDRKRFLSTVGPLSMVGTIGVWVGVMIIGWALIIWPQLPVEFSYGAGVPKKASFVEAIYVSQVTLVTLGFGDIVPGDGWLRIVVPMEALLGFGLLSASTSWLLSIYPPISRRHFLAHELAISRKAHSDTTMDATELSAQVVVDYLQRMTSQAISVRSDLVQFPILYFFHSGDLRTSLPSQLPFLLAQATLYTSQQTSAESAAGEVNFHATRLRIALDDLAISLNSFLKLGANPPTQAVLTAYEKDHLDKEGGGEVSL